MRPSSFVVFTRLFSVRFPTLCVVQVEQAGVLQNIRVVLVGTSHPGNIGGAARAMKNMGLSKLVLVHRSSSPIARPMPAPRVPTISSNPPWCGHPGAGAGGCSLVYGTSARDRHIPGRCWTLASARPVASSRSATGPSRPCVRARIRRPDQRRAAALPVPCAYPSDPALGSLNLRPPCRC